MSDTKISKTTTKPSGNPMVKDRLKSARALVEMHRHDRALEEYNRLLDKKFITSEVIKGVAQCLVHLVRPAKIAAVVDNIANDIFKNPRNRRAFKLSIAKKINSEQFPQHYSALSHFLVR